MVAIFNLYLFDDLFTYISLCPSHICTTHIHTNPNAYTCECASVVFKRICFPLAFNIYEQSEFTFRRGFQQCHKQVISAAERKGYGFKPLGIFRTF